MDLYDKNIFGLSKEKELSEKIDIILKENNISDLKMLSKAYEEKQIFLEEDTIEKIVNHSSKVDKIKSQVENSEADLLKLSQLTEKINKSISKSNKELKTTFEDIHTLEISKRNLIKMINLLTDFSSLEIIYNELQKVYENNYNASNYQLSDQIEGTSIRKSRYLDASRCASAVNDFLRKLNFLRGKVERLQSIELNYQKIKNYFVDVVYEDFGKYKALVKSSNFDNRPEINSLLQSGCLLLENLGHPKEEEKRYLIDWIIDIHLQEYEQTELEKLNAINLTEIAKHLQTYQAILKDFNKNYQPVFPKDWAVSFALTKRFFQITNQKYSSLIENSMPSINLQEYAQILKFCVNFEKEVSSYFEKNIVHPLSELFLTQKKSYISHEKKQMEKFNRAVKSLHFTEIASEGNISLRRVAQIDPLFLYIKNSLSFFAQITNSELFADICVEYKAAVSDLIASINFLISKAENPLYKTTDQTTVLKALCLITETCLHTKKLIFGLSTKISKTLLENKKSLKVNFEEEVLKLKKAENKAINGMAECVSKSCFLALSEIKNKNWIKNADLGDPGEYTRKLYFIFQRQIGYLRENCPYGHYVVFCGRFCDLFVAGFKGVLYSCRNMTKTGAQQLLLDIYSIKKSLTKFLLPEKSDSSRKVLKKTLVAKISALEGILKILSADEFSLSSFLVLFPANSEDDLKAILGVKYGGKKVVGRFIAEYREISKN